MANKISTLFNQLKQKIKNMFKSDKVVPKTP